MKKLIGCKPTSKEKEDKSTFVAFQNELHPMSSESFNRFLVCGNTKTYEWLQTEQNDTMKIEHYIEIF